MNVSRDFVRTVLKKVNMRPGEWETIRHGDYAIHFYLDTEKYEESWRDGGKFNRSLPSTKNVMEQDGIWHFYGEGFKNLLSVKLMNEREIEMYCVHGSAKHIQEHLKKNYGVVVQIPEQPKQEATMTVEEYRKRFMETEQRRAEGEAKLNDIAKEYGIIIRTYSGAANSQREERAAALFEMGLLFDGEIISKKRVGRKVKKAELKPQERRLSHSHK